MHKLVLVGAFAVLGCSSPGANPPGPDAGADAQPDVATDAPASDGGRPKGPTLPNGASFYVSPSGTPSGDGSMSNPWDIDTALHGPPQVKPGDTIWIRGGKYGGGQSDSVIQSSLVGTDTNPILVRAYPGERATIDAGLRVGCCDQAPDPKNGSYTWFWGLEFASYNPDRTSGTSGPPEYAAQQNHPSVDVWAAGTKLIDCIVHDTSGGISVWDAAGTELYGNIVFDIGGYGTDRGHGHDFYLQNQAPSVLDVRENIGFDNFDMGIQAYGSDSAWVQNMHFTGNVVFDSGILYSGQLVDNLTLGGGQGGPSGMVLTDNFFYDTPSATTGYNELGYLWTPVAHDATATNNVFVGGTDPIALERWTSVTFRNNTIYGSSANDAMLIVGSGESTSAYDWGNNRYFGTGQFLLYPSCDNWPCPTSSTLDFAGFQKSTGLDQASTLAAGAPTGVWSFVRPSAWEVGRANIVVFDWDKTPSVSIDLGPSGIQIGDAYQIRDAENWYGGSVVTGTYDGSPVSIPMTGLKVVQPFGTVPYAPSHTAPEFGVFVLLSYTALTNTF